VHRVECHFECHSILKIGKRTQTDANASKNWKTLNRCGLDRCGEEGCSH